jgi:long-chain acyl-CoA synthetase
MLPAQIRRSFETRYHVPIYEGYGLAECSPLVTTFSAWVPRVEENACSMGLPITGVEVAIWDAKRRHVPEEKIGEIFVRGPWTMKGYLDGGQISQNAFENGWLDTGDLGMMDRQGFLYLVDRRADVILKAGFPVYPSEVEAVLAQHPKIEECAVIGVPDRLHGEEVKAYVVVRPKQFATKEEIVEFCKAGLAIYKCPRHVEFCESLPHSVTGKVLKRLLREKKPAPLVVAAETQPAAEAGTSQVEATAVEAAATTAVDNTPIERTVDEVQSG